MMCLIAFGTNMEDSMNLSLCMSQKFTQSIRLMLLPPSLEEIIHREHVNMRHGEHAGKTRIFLGGSVFKDSGIDLDVIDILNTSANNLNLPLPIVETEMVDAWGSLILDKTGYRKIGAGEVVYTNKTVYVHHAVLLKARSQTPRPEVEEQPTKPKTTPAALFERLEAYARAQHG
jgi:hypothetical protein